MFSTTPGPERPSSPDWATNSGVNFPWPRVFRFLVSSDVRKSSWQLLSLFVQVDLLNERNLYAQINCKSAMSILRVVNLLNERYTLCKKAKTILIALLTLFALVSIQWWDLHVSKASFTLYKTSSSASKVMGTRTDGKSDKWQWIPNLPLSFTRNEKERPERM